MEGPSRINSSEEPGREPERRRFLKLAVKGMTAIVGAKIAGGRKTAEAVAGVKETPAEIEKQFEDWQNLKKIYQEGRVEENLRWLQEQFGNAPGFFYVLHLDLGLIRTMLHERDTSLKNTERGRQFLKGASKAYQNFWSKDAIESRRKTREAKEGLDAKFIGFEKVYLLTNEEFRNELETRLNRRWLYGNISVFNMIDGGKKLNHMHVGGEAYGAGLQSLLGKSEKSEARLYKWWGIHKRDLVPVAAHEVSHHNDWENNNRMPLHERLQFLRETMERFQSSDRMPHRYVDEVARQEFSSQGGDEKQVRYRLLREYWAVLGEEFTLRPEELKQKYPKDYALFEKWYRRLTED